MIKVSKITFYFIKMLNNLLILRRIKLYVNIWSGKRIIKLPILNGIGYQNIFTREEWLDNIIRAIFQFKKGAFIDVGANLGQTLLKVISIDESREYFGFEPNSLCCYYVDEIIRKNRLSNHHILPCGLSNKDGVHKLHLKDRSDPSASLIKGFRPESFYSTSMYTSVFEGDSLLKSIDISTTAIIKIDVEGMELEVIQGLRNTIRTHKPYIICEVLPVWDSETETGKFRKDRIDILQNIIEEESYVIFRILHGGKVVELTGLEPLPDLSLCDYIFVPINEKEKAFNLLEVESKYT